MYIEKFEDFISDKIYSKKLFIDYKTKLQEYFHKEDHRKVNYAIEKEEGPDHDKTFYMVAYYKNEEIGRGFGKNKKLAEQMAAKDAFLKLEKNKK